MSYTKVNWTNTPSTPLNAENLNHMDDGIAAAEITANKVVSEREINDQLTQYPSIRYIKDNYIESSYIAQTYALRTDVLPLQTDVSSLQTDNTKNKNDISTLKTDNTKNKNDISTLKTDNTKNKSDISALKEESAKITDISGLHAAYVIGFDSNNKPIRCSKVQNGIGAGLFTGNKELKTVYIPKQVLALNSGTFNGCDNLTDIYVDNLRSSGKPGINEGSMPSEVDVKLHYRDDSDYEDWTIIDSLVESVVKFGTYETMVDSLKDSSFSIFSSTDQFWTDSDEVYAWSFKPNSIYNISYAKMNKIKDIPDIEAANTSIITFGGNGIKSPSKINDLYSEKTGANSASGGTTQMLFSNNGKFYQRYKDGSTYEYGEWRTIINKDNLETFIKQSSYIKTLEARIAALEKKN